MIAPVERVKIMFQVTHEPFHLRKLPSILVDIVRTERYQCERL